MRTHSPNKLRDIALSLIRGDIACDWMTDEHEVSLLSEIDYLIHSTQDIGMRYELYENELTKDKQGNPIFATFQTLTHDEALQVAEMFLRYKAFTDVYVEVEIPNERMNPYVI